MAKEEGSSDFFGWLKSLFDFSTLEHTGSLGAVDYVKLSDASVEKEVDEMVARETGRDRVKKIFTFDETKQSYSQDLTELRDLVGPVAIAGFIIGGSYQNHVTQEFYKNQTQLTIFADRKASARSYVDHVFFQTLKGGIAYAARFSFFAGIILSGSMVTQAYRNKSTPFDYTIGGLISGGLIRMNHGLFSFAFGSAVGGLFGTMIGVVRYAQLKLGNTTYEERNRNEFRKKIIDRKILLGQIELKKDAGSKTSG